jgi:hypothetical protein
MTLSNTTSTVKGANWPDARWTFALRSWIGDAAAVIVRFKPLAQYALIELVLPGGSVMALLLWLYRRRKNSGNLGVLSVRLWPVLACLAHASIRLWSRPALRNSPCRSVRSLSVAS